jgi:hypothetical protein
MNPSEKTKTINPYFYHRLPPIKDGFDQFSSILRSINYLAVKEPNITPVPNSINQLARHSNIWKLLCSQDLTPVN